MSSNVMPDKVKARRSLLALLVGMVTITVFLVLAIHAAHLYFSQKQKIIDETRGDVAVIVTRLKNNIAPFVESYAANEYAKLVANEIDLRPYYAIVVEDFNMGKILGQAAFVTGKIDTGGGQYADIETDDPGYQRLLDLAYFKDSAEIKSSGGERIGIVSVYLTDEAMQRQLRQLLLESLSVMASTALLLAGLLVVFAHRLLIHPMRQIALAIKQRDGDGIPLSAAPDFAYREVAALTDTINTMLGVIRQSRDTLQQERRRLENVIDGTNAGTWEWNIPSGKLVINERWARMLGYSVEELSPVTVETWSSNVHPDDLKGTMDLLDRHFKGKSPGFKTEIRMRHKLGHWVWVLGLGRVIERTADGQPLQMSGTHIDISDRKQQELELSEQGRRLNDILVGTNIGTWEWNVQTGETVFNERWAEIIGYRLEELEPVSIETWTKFAHPDDLKAAEELLEKHFSGEVPFYECEARMRHKDGHWVWVQDRGRVATWTDDGKPLLMSGTHQEITERKEAEVALIEAKRAAETANLAKSRFLATMSHEIRTPMNGILGMAQMLLMDNIDEGERRDFARTILNSGQTLLTLLNDILDFSKIEAGKLELDNSVIDPEQILRETANLFQENAANKGLALEASWEGKRQGAARRYLADPHRLRQMLSNLTNNAIKFTAQGKVSLQAREIERSDDAALLEFSVSDTGIGIEADKQELLFKPFSQADSSIARQFGGTGLGLSIVRSLAQKMGGDIGVTSAPGQGSRFWFRIRADLVQEDIDRRHSARANEEMAISSGQLKGNILVVEDNLTNQKVIQALLKKLGLSCRIAPDGQAGVQAVELDPSIDLILMDIQMPAMDGYEATKAIRTRETETQKRHLSIIAMTANAYDEDRQRCLDAGMDDFLAKPISFDKLILVLQRWLPPGKA